MDGLLQPNKEPRELKPRAAVMAVVAAGAFLVLLARLYDLQLIHGVELARKGRDNYVKTLVVPAPRGMILDRHGLLLASNRASFDVYVTPQFCQPARGILDKLATLIGLTAEEESAALAKIARARGLDRYQPILVKLDIGRDALDVLLANQAELDGVDMIPSPHRRYGPLADEEKNELFARMLAHVVGYMSEVTAGELKRGHGKYRQGDFIGRRGLEKSFEKELRGVDGKRLVAVDAKGRELDPAAQKELIPRGRLVPAKAGHNVVLSLDLGLETLAWKALSAAGKAGAVAVVDVHTGALLALVSYPAYDPNEMTGRISRQELQALVKDPLQPLFARALQQQYHPGSTFKVVTALAALAGGYVKPTSTTVCHGGFRLGNRTWRCWKKTGHGVVDLTRGIQHSCDVYFYWLASKMGLDPIADMAERLGFGRPTGLGLGPEAAGVVPTVAYHERVDHWYSKGFALNAAIGQGAVNVTALQLVMAYAAIANGGTLYRPTIVSRIEDPDGKVAKEVRPRVARRLRIPAADLDAVKKGLFAVVNEPGGTAYYRRLSDVLVAGKTGTAQVVQIGKKRLKEDQMPWKDRDDGWFVAYAPADAPEIAVSVINEHAGEGAYAAEPVAMAVIQGYFDLKKERAAGVELSPEEIANLVPDPQYASPSLRRLSGRAPVAAANPGGLPSSTDAALR